MSHDPNKGNAIAAGAYPQGEAGPHRGTDNPAAQRLINQQQALGEQDEMKTTGAQMRNPTEGALQGISKENQSIGEMATRNQLVTDSDNQKAYEVISSPKRTIPTRTPNDLCVLLRRPLLVKTYDFNATGNTNVRLNWGYNTPFAAFPAETVMNRIAMMYAYFIGDLSYDLVTQSGAQSTLVIQNLPQTGATTDVRSLADYSTMGNFPYDFTGSPQLVMKGNGAARVTLPYRHLYRGVLTTGPDPSLGNNTLQSTLLLSNYNNTSADSRFYVYASLADGAGFSQFLGVPLLQFTLPNGKRSVTHDRVIINPPSK